MASTEEAHRTVDTPNRTGWIDTTNWPVGSPVVGQNQDGRLEVFRVDVRGELFHKWQKETNGDWSPWVSLGGRLWLDIAVANQADGRLEAFAVDRVTRLLRYKWQTAPNHPDFDWTTWITVGDSSMFRPPA